MPKRPIDAVMLKFLATVFACAYVLFLVGSCYLVTFCCFIPELAGFRREHPSFEGDKLIYRS